MENDQMPRNRRSVLCIAAGVAAAAAVALLADERFESPAAGPAGPSAAPALGGPQAGTVSTVRKSSAYRLQPMTAFAPARLARGTTPVRQQAFVRMPGLGRSMVLTFDDGPDPRWTPQILKTLRLHGVRAMFFVCGEMAVQNRDLLREMADDGHVVGNHSWSHPLLPELAPARVRDELGRTSEVIERTLGTPPLWYRAPYGAWDRHSFAIGAELGMEPVAWTIDTLDWCEPGTGSIVGRVMGGAEPGAIVLSHDAGGDRSQSVAALSRYLPKLLQAGYRIKVPTR
ncbi:polysaccharide deacetylase family protein [Streptomyces sp. NPDC006678]|uniref:polysaccharide deacetylase family protein n=1 Tax=Streptomyces sp. NPDC006678 TaxID=3157185 RepID=UPI00340A0045